MSLPPIKDTILCLNPTFGYQNRIHARTSKELKAISKEIRTKKPSDTVYSTKSIDLDQAELMVNHRSRLANSRLEEDRQKVRPPHNKRDISAILDPIKAKDIKNDKHAELVSILGNEIPEPLFELTNDIKQLKSQVEKAEFAIFTESEIASEIFSRSNFGKPEKTTKFFTPAGKKDVEALNEWLDYMLQSAYDAQHTKDQLFENVQIIYSACLNEIIRQVSVHCSQRGQLLNRVWKAYFSLMVMSLKTYQASKISLQLKTNNKIKISEAKISEISTNLRHDMNLLTEENNSLKLVVEEQRKSLEKLRYQQRVQQNRHNVILSKYEKDKLRLLRLEDTNQNLNNLINSVLDDIDSGIPGIKKLKEKNKIRFRDLTKIIISDPLLNPTEEQPPENEAELEKFVEREKIELEHKILMQEIQEKMQETEDELVDIGVDTRDFIMFDDKCESTEIDCFVEPVVDVLNVVSTIAKPDFSSQIVAILNGEAIEEAEMSYYLNLEDLKEYDESESEAEELYLVPEAKYFEITENLVLRLEIKALFDEVHRINSRKYAVMLRKMKYYKNKRNTYTRILKEFRKALFAASKENAQLQKTIKMLKENTRPVKKSIKPKVEKKKKLTVAKGFQLGRRNSSIGTKVIFDYSPVLFILNKITSGKCTDKLTLSRKGLIKILNLFIADWISLPEEVTSVTRSLTNFFYFYISSKYNNRKIIDSNFTQYILAIDSYKSNSTLANNFSRFLGIREESLSIEYFKMFIEITKMLTNACKHQEHYINDDEEVIISIIRAEEVIEEYWKGKITCEEMEDLRLRIKSKEKPCPKQFNLNGVIIKGDLVDINILKYMQYVEKSKNSIRDLFDGADLSGEGYLTLDEFDLMYRNIEKTTYTPFYAKLLFTSYSDLIAELEDKEYPALSYNKFSYLCVEKSLFRIEIQNSFLGIKENSDLRYELENLYINCDYLINQLKWRLAYCSPDSMQFKMIKSLKAKILKNEGRRSTFITYKLLESDTREKVMFKEMKNFYPKIVSIFDKAQLLIEVDRSPLRRQNYRDSKEDSSNEDNY